MSQKSRPKKLILFDIDGTLLLTGGAGSAAFNNIFKKLYNLEGAWQNIVPDGKTDPAIIEELFLKHFHRKPQGHELKQVWKAYEQEMAKTLEEAERFRLMPGTMDLLQALEDRELGLLGLATGNFEKTAWLKLKRAGMAHFFHFGGFASDASKRLDLTKIAFERGMSKLGSRVHPDDVIVVGDTVHDVRCGKQLGANTLAVATGATAMQTLKDARPDFLFENFLDLEEVLTAFL